MRPCPRTFSTETPARCLLVRSCVLLPGSRIILSVSLFSLVPAFFFLPPGLLFSFQSNLVSFCAVVHERLLEPRVLQSLLGRYALLGVVHEYSPQEIEELFVEVGVARYCFLQALVETHESKEKRTWSFFIAFTYFFDALLISLLG